MLRPSRSHEKIEFSIYFFHFFSAPIVEKNYQGKKQSPAKKSMPLGQFCGGPFFRRQEHPPQIQNWPAPPNPAERGVIFGRPDRKSQT